MATIALYAVGSYFAGPFGGALGAAVGSYIDQNYLFPALFGGPKGAVGSRLTELPISGSEGNLMPFMLGDKAIVDGQIIDKSEIIEEKIEEEQGGKGGGATSTRFKYYLHLALSWGETFPGPITKMLTIWANGKVIFAKDDLDTSVAASATHYLGSPTQMPNSLLESLHGGVGTVPAYRGQVYTVFERLSIEFFGNSVPTFRALVQCQNGISVREAILRIHERWGIERSKVDVSRINACLRGLAFTGPIPGNQLLEAIMTAYQIVRRESGGKLVYRHRGDEDHVEINPNDLGAAPEGETQPALSVRDGKLQDLATHCDVTFVDPDADDQRGSVSDRRVGDNPRTNRTVNLRLVIPADRAKRVARQAIFQELVERQEARFTLPAKRYLQLEENDLARIVYKGRVYLVRVTQLERGANWQLVCEGRLVEDQVWKAKIKSDRGTSGVGNVYEPPALAWEPMDLPPLLTEHATAFGFYSAIAAQLPTAKWLGANLYGSADEIAWSLASRRSAESSIGKSTTTLASGPVGNWDRGNTVEVEMLEGELASVTEAEVLNGANWMLLGNEIVGFANATLLGTTLAGARRYRLFNLGRGLRDTASAIGTHATDERAVLLTTTSLDFNASAYSLLGAARKLRAVPTGATVESQTSKTMTLSGRTLRPFAVCDVRGSRDGADNIEVTWRRRTRAMTRLFQTAPALDDQRVYDVVVKLAGTPVRTERVTDEVWTYAAADQTTDGITPGDPVTIEVYQISTTVGRGNIAAATV